MKYLKTFENTVNEFVNERVTKYKTYISKKFIKSSNLDLNDALDALFSLNYDEHEIMNSIKRTLKKQRPDIADDFEDDLIDLEGTLTGVFDVIKRIKNKIDDLE